MIKICFKSPPGPWEICFLMVPDVRLAEHLVPALWHESMNGDPERPESICSATRSDASVTLPREAFFIPKKIFEEARGHKRYHLPKVGLSIDF